jgi:hypothetical protein
MVTMGMTRHRYALGVGVGAVVMLGAGAASAQQPVCRTPKTTCAAIDGYYASTEDRNRVTAVVDPLIAELKSCIDAAGGKHVSPAITIRWDSDGNPVAVKIDAPGYETLPCAATVAGKLAQLKNPHETAIRCDYGCSAPPTSAPVVVPPPPPPASSNAPPPPAGSAAPAPAPAASSPPPKTEKTEKVWYGYQTLIIDAVSGTFFLTGVYTASGSLWVPGFVGYVFGTPIDHFIHGNVGKGFGSIAIRLFFPAIAAGIGAIVGVFITSDKTDPAGIVTDHVNHAAEGAEVGLLIGVVITSAIDAFAFAYTKESAEALATPKTQRAWLTVKPTLSLTSDRGVIGLGGTF